MNIDPFTLATSLARPIAKGLLPIAGAEAALAALAARQARQGLGPPRGDLAGTIKLSGEILWLAIEREQRQRDRVAGLIARSTFRLIDALLDQKATRGLVRAEAHDVNAAEGWPFTEGEVEALLVSRLRAAMAKRAGGGPAPVRRPRPRRG